MEERIIGNGYPLLTTHLHILYDSQCRLIVYKYGLCILSELFLKECSYLGSSAVFSNPSCFIHIY